MRGGRQGDVVRKLDASRLVHDRHGLPAALPVQRTALVRVSSQPVSGHDRPRHGASVRNRGVPPLLRPIPAERDAHLSVPRWHGGLGTRFSSVPHGGPTVSRSAPMPGSLSAATGESFPHVLVGERALGERITVQHHGIVGRLHNRTLEVRGSIPLGSTRKRKGLAAMRGLFVFRRCRDRSALEFGYAVAGRGSCSRNRRSRGER